MSDEKLREYEELKRFFEVWSVQLFPNKFFAADHPHHPVNSLASIEQKFGRSRALSGLKQVVNDNLESVRDLGSAQISQLDEALRQAGVLTLSQLLTRQSSAFMAVLRRGKIRNEVEFYLVCAALADTSVQRPESELAVLGSMAAAYKATA